MEADIVRQRSHYLDPVQFVSNGQEKVCMCGEVRKLKRGDDLRKLCVCGVCVEIAFLVVHRPEIQEKYTFQNS